MRLWPAAALALGALGFCWPARGGAQRNTLVVYGDTEGYMAPCGCTKPMSGGIARAATVIRHIEEGGDQTAFVLAGGLVEDAGRQSALKLDAYAEAARDLNAAAVSLTPPDAALGQGAIYSMDALSDHKLLASNIAPSLTSTVASLAGSGAFQILSIARDPAKLALEIGEKPMSTAAVMNSVAMRNVEVNKTWVALFDGDEQEARTLAERYPNISVWVYRSQTDPPSRPVKVGNATLVTPGYHGKFVITLSFENGRMVGYGRIQLGPDVAGDPQIGSVYSRYLGRVGDERLLASWPRILTSSYAGSAACRTCHEGSYKVWFLSGHRRAYADLAERGHGLDPDCVKCHVVGLSSQQGFISRSRTPRLANVGCESCHGPAARHASHPDLFHLPNISPRACLSCHEPENSPGFEFATYWKKVAH